jgi:hypothetical protein
MTQHHSLVPGRSCGQSCNLCCKVYPLPWVDSRPAGKWCKHCKPGQGCAIWQARPDECVKFHCQWMYDASLGPEWKPEVARFVMNFSGGKTLAVMVDPGNRNAWKREPYYSKFKEMFPLLHSKGMMIVIADGVHKILVTPEEDFILCKQTENVAYTLRREHKGPHITWRVDIEDDTKAA